MQKFAGVLAAIVLTLGSAQAQSQAQEAANYPNRPVRFILGFAAGGGTDLLARIIGPKVADILGQPVIIENRTGRFG